MRSAYILLIEYFVSTDQPHIYLIKIYYSKQNIQHCIFHTFPSAT